ncbi:hypothetical protein BU24DRAFT_461049 [Aaosphaeria arxii CBS 175.79]|uniref:Rhodopsin domain-containing protein n=1 Tax=Aaosphaeria arxii CBS 175.79 TaxID=1450172 RepID=A0A6A5XXK9_9PLEO|nr:uncharacterized protein BU24DRAFT_461049 [Aaosphaeria arxii CBS 175.79]KAF2018075.1 hypothetical protein BU24DRAFT_461049 [Aaosphaeria arxii CBS 175.79]
MISASTGTQASHVGRSSQPLLNVCISFAILETFFVIAFIFSWHFNGKANRSSRVTYILILIGYLFCFGGIIVGILKITIGGAGYHSSTLSPSTIQAMLKLIKAHEFIYVSSILFPKLAILALYHRLFTFKWSRYVIYFTGFLVVTTFLFGFISALANCRPLPAFWNPEVDPKCTMDVMAVFQYYSVPNITADTLVLVLPLLIIVLPTFSVLTFISGIITAVLRFVTFLNVDLFNDITYYSISTTSWTIIEPGVYLMAATMPTLRPLVRHIFQKYNTPRFLTRSSPTLAPTDESWHSMTSTATLVKPPPRVLRKKSTRSLGSESAETIGRRPSRTLQLDDYHSMHSLGLVRVRSADEESMVCADAVIHETMGQQGRNPDGTLRGWSLQRPQKLSPLRTSFCTVKK